MRYALNHADVVFCQAFCISSSALELAGGLKVTERGRTIGEMLYAGSRLEELPVHPVNAKRIPQAVKNELIADALVLQTVSLLRSFNVTRPSWRDRGGTVIWSPIALGRWRVKHGDQ